MERRKRNKKLSKKKRKRRKITEDDDDAEDTEDDDTEDDDAEWKPPSNIKEDEDEFCGIITARRYLERRAARNPRKRQKIARINLCSDEDDDVELN